MNLIWCIREWNEISAEELYECFRLRVAVFVVEQNCPYQEADGKDKKSTHLFAKDDYGKVHAYLRIVHPGVSYAEVSIGRVVSEPETRHTGLGREAMKRGMDFIREKFGNVQVRISAQSYLQKFYESFGFLQVSEPYLEDDIPHIEMLFTPLR